jgi:Mor family transcriptional regulator
MDKLIQTIQDEINNLMNSRQAKLTDGQLMRAEKMSIPHSLVMTIYEDYMKENISMPKLGEKYSISMAVIQKCFKKYKLKARPIAKFSDELRGQQIEDIKNQMSHSDFVKKYDCSKHMYFRLKREIAGGPSFKRNKFDDLEMYADIKKGMGVNEVRTKYDCSTNTYYRMKKKVEKNLVD